MNKKEYMKKWRLERKKYIKDYNKKYRENHIEYFKEYMKNYKIENKERIKELYELSKLNGKRKEYDRRKYLKYKDKIIKRVKKYLLNNPEKRKRWTYNWRKKHVDIYRKIYKKSNAKRRSINRKLKFNLLWQPEIINEKMVYHHINKIFVVLIPERIHKLIQHNIFTGKNMKEINNIIFQYIINSIVFPRKKS